MNIAIVGAGVTGRLCAMILAEAGCNVDLFDLAPLHARENCSWAAAGLLAPQFEAVRGPSWLRLIGADSLKLWPEILANLPRDVFFQHAGALLLAHQRDAAELALWQQRGGTGYAILPAPTLAAEFSDHWLGCQLPNEGQIDCQAVMQALAEYCLAHCRIQFYQSSVDEVCAKQLIVQGKKKQFDWVVDCRGLGAKKDLPGLRGVRGESLLLYAPDVRLTLPMHLLHPRMNLYCLPRCDSHYLVGASEIESENLGSITVLTTLELLSALYACHSGFANAQILDSFVHCRPAFQDHAPRLQYQAGYISLNGLFRCGFLLAPKMAKTVLQLLHGQAVSLPFVHLIQDRSMIYETAY